MKKGIQITFNFSNRATYTFIAVIILLITGVGVYASSFKNDDGVGHDLTEIGFPQCIAGQVLGFANGNWVCTNFPSSSGDNLGNHIATQNLNLNLNSITNVDSLSVNSLSGPAWVGNKWIPDGTEISCEARYVADATYSVVGYARVNNGKIELRAECNGPTNCKSSLQCDWTNSFGFKCINDYGWASWHVSYSSSTGKFTLYNSGSRYFVSSGKQSCSVSF